MLNNTKFLKTILLWVASFYPIYLGVHLLLDHFAGAQAFRADLMRGSQRLLLRHVVEGWLASVWIPIIFAGLFLIKWPFDKLGGQPSKARWAVGLALIAAIKMVLALPVISVVPFVTAFLTISTFQTLFFGDEP